MKTGIIRRVDDLGRIVIPKEIRKSLRIDEGDPLEISISNNGVHLERYVPIYEFRAQAKIYLRTFYKQYKAPIALCDRYEVIASEGVHITPNSRIANSLEFHVNESTEYIHRPENTSIPVVEGRNFYTNAVIPIATNTDKLGGLILIRQSDEHLTEEQLYCVRFLAGLIADQAALD